METVALGHPPSWSWIDPAQVSDELIVNESLYTLTRSQPLQTIWVIPSPHSVRCTSLACTGWTSYLALHLIPIVTTAHYDLSHKSSLMQIAHWTKRLDVRQIYLSQRTLPFKHRNVCLTINCVAKKILTALITSVLNWFCFSEVLIETMICDKR
jgi:hypothetical protein